MIPTPDEALALLKEDNQGEFHLNHGQIVGDCMRWFAADQGFAGEADFWQAVGILHDLDFEQFPEQHCIKSQELMREKGLDERIIRATASHGFGITVEIKPEHEMEKVLFAVDELTGLVGAAAVMRPSGSVSDLEVKSVKKKFKDKRFAAKCDRELIKQGCEMLGMEVKDVAQICIDGMRPYAAEIGLLGTEAE